ncbi:MAG: hypothetical protein AAGA46_03400 [Cyanobacteria bacterium P01_F01_bin.13]
MNYFHTTKLPYECNVEFDADWMYQPLLGADQSCQTIDESWEPESQSVLHQRIAEMGRNGKTLLLGLVALSGVVFFSSLAIAERSGELHQIRGDSLSTARNASMVLGLGAVGAVFWLRRK